MSKKERAPPKRKKTKKPLQPCKIKGGPSKKLIEEEHKENEPDPNVLFFPKARVYSRRANKPNKLETFPVLLPVATQPVDVPKPKPTPNEEAPQENPTIEDEAQKELLRLRDHYAEVDRHVLRLEDAPSSKPESNKELLSKYRVNHAVRLLLRAQRQQKRKNKAKETNNTEAAEAAELDDQDSLEDKEFALDEEFDRQLREDEREFLAEELVQQDPILEDPEIWKEDEVIAKIKQEVESSAELKPPKLPQSPAVDEFGEPSFFSYISPIPKCKETTVPDPQRESLVAISPIVKTEPVSDENQEHPTFKTPANPKPKRPAKRANKNKAK